VNSHDATLNQHRCRWHIAAAIIACVGFFSPVHAGGGVGTANSREAAIQQATALMPEGSVISDADCSLQSGGGFTVYTCNVEWEP
jgi:hypothetical protein